MYTVRCVVRVLRPCESISDDYQDSVVLSQTPTCVELEVIHNPLNTVANSILAAGSARAIPDSVRRYQKPGITTNWDEEMRQDVIRELKRDGIDTCTSTAIYPTTGLRAVGRSTRMILVVPIVDSSDSEQLRMVERGISHHRLRTHIRKKLPSSGSFSSHTFNETFVAGR